MTGNSAICAELAGCKENELIIARKLYREKLSAVVSEAAYYKALERMCKSGKLIRAAKGIYHLPKKSKYGIVPLSENEIVRAFTEYGSGTIIGYSLYNKLGLTTQIPKTIHVMSSSIDEKTKTIKNVVIHRSELIFDNAVEDMIHGLDVLQNYDTIQDLDYNAFVSFSRSLAKNYNDVTFEKVIASKKYKKSTITFLYDVLNYYGVSNDLEKYLSSVSRYRHKTMEEICNF